MNSKNTYYGQYLYTKQAEVRLAFWEDHPGLTWEFTAHQRRKLKPDEYSKSIQCLFRNWIRATLKAGLISESLASKATL
jgi:hypothetical protein